MKKGAALLMLAIVIAAAYNYVSTRYTMNSNVVVIKAGSDTTIHVTSKNKLVSAVVLAITGAVNDTCKIAGGLIPGGTVDTVFKSDHYAQVYMLSFEAYKATAGNLPVKVRF